jgi:hypothetical protein
VTTCQRPHICASRPNVATEQNHQQGERTSGYLLLVFIVAANMKSYTFIAVLLAAILGIAMAFIRPVQPVQVGQQYGGPASAVSIGLDNPGIPEDSNIHPARKCGFCMGVSFGCPCITHHSTSSLYHSEPDRRTVQSAAYRAATYRSSLQRQQADLYGRVPRAA